MNTDVGLWPQLISCAPVADCYVVDICPWALTVAKERRISAYLTASFTWVEQYENYAPVELIDKCKAAFQCANSILYYALANKPTRKLLGRGKEIGFVCRPFDCEKVKQIRAKHEKPIVFISLGVSNNGLASVIDVSQIPYDFITTSALNFIGSNVSKLPLDIDNTNDYVAAADYCIAKAGWSTVSEMMIARSRFAVINRPNVPEDTMLIREVVRRGAGIAINGEDLQNISSVIKRLKEYSKSTESIPIISVILQILLQRSFGSNL